MNAALISGLNGPQGIAVSGPNLFVVDALDGTIGEFDAITGATVNAALVSGLNGPDVIAVISNPLGDYNGDGIVDAADYTVWHDSLGSKIVLAADGNGNGMIDAGDYDVWRANFGQTAGSDVALPSTSPRSAGVPEPASAVLLTIGCIVTLVVRRLRHLKYPAWAAVEPDRRDLSPIEITRRR